MPRIRLGNPVTPADDGDARPGLQPPPGLQRMKDVTATGQAAWQPEQRHKGIRTEIHIQPMGNAGETERLGVVLGEIFEHR